MSSTQVVSLADRDIRQRQIIPPEKLAGVHAVVIGVGAIGRQVALQLAAVGMVSMDLIDFDVVGVENLAPQAYWPEDVGQKKVQATAALCQKINPMCSVQIRDDRYRRSTARDLKMLSDPQVKAVIFACVDSIEVRGILWASVRSRASLFVDGRMSAEVIRVLASEHPATDSYYATTLFAPEQAYSGACTARSTVYTASIAAGLMLSQFTKWLRNLPVDRDLMLNLLSAELTAS